MKNKLPLILLLASGAGVFFWLRRKAAAGANLRYEPIDIAIDSSRSAASLFSRIYYNVKLRLINNESANVNIRSINLQVFLKVANRQERKLGDVINNNAFQVPAQGSQEIKLDTSISTGSVLQILKDALIEGLQFSIKITGYIDTDLGRVNVNFTKDFGTGSIGIQAPRIKKVKYKYDDKLYSYQNKTKPGYVRFIKKSDNPDFEHMYKLALFDDAGYSYSSNWINEKSLSRKKLA